MQVLVVSLGSMASLGSQCRPRGPWVRLQEQPHLSGADLLRQVSAFCPMPCLSHALTCMVAEHWLVEPS